MSGGGGGQPCTPLLTVIGAVQSESMKVKVWTWGCDSGLRGVVWAIRKGGVGGSFGWMYLQGVPSFCDEEGIWGVGGGGKFYFESY